MNSAKVLFRRVAYATAVMAMATNACFATPLNNPYDTQPLYTYYCSDKFYKNRDKGEIRIHISPFYQSASKARDTNGTKVAGGDRLGAWNMIGVLFDALKGYARQDFAADVSKRYASYLAPTTKPFPYPTTIFPATGTFDTAPASRIGIFGSDPGLFLPVASNTDYKSMYNALGTVVEVSSQDATNRYRIKGDRIAVLANDPTGADGSNLTQSQYFNPDQHAFAYVSVPVSYEKIGVRSQINFDFGFGLGVSVKGGVVDVKQRMKRFDLEQQFILDRGERPPGFVGPLLPPVADAVTLYDNLLSPAAI